MTKVTNVDSRNVVQSLAKGFRILEAFSAEQPELKLSDVARRAELDAGTAFRLLNTLVMIGYLEKSREARTFRLSLKALDLGFNAIARIDLREIAAIELRRLLGPVQEAASLGVLYGDEVVYIERIKCGPPRLGGDIRVGTRLPAHASALGHAILAFLPNDEAMRIFNMRARAQVNRFSPAATTDFAMRLEAVRSVGYAVTDGDIVPGWRALAAPILGADGNALAAINVGAVASASVSLDEFVDISAGPLLKAASQITRAISAAGKTVVSVSR